MSEWDLNSVEASFHIPVWSAGYAGVGRDGRLRMFPRREPDSRGVDLVELAEEVLDTGLSLPVLVRFTDILSDRVERMVGAFDAALASHGLDGGYTCLYPIKVNQQRSVVDHIVHQGGRRVGLEAGSKPELLAVLAVADREGGVIVCNGYKDRAYVRLALIGQQIGQRVHIVIEQPRELRVVLEEAAALGVEPVLGVRIRLASLGKGNWQNTGGERSKFGLSASEVLRIIERLRRAGKLHWLRLLHFHMGSQIADLADIRTAIREAVRYYAELRRLGVPLSAIDVGGGLGVDYEGRGETSFCSMNYGLGEYADVIVTSLAEVCARHELPHPEIFTEAGRALTAHHAVLITDVIDVETAESEPDCPPQGDETPSPLRELCALRGDCGKAPPGEEFARARELLATLYARYAAGEITLEERAAGEGIYRGICRSLSGLAADSDPALADDLNELLADKYFLNLSVFQSVPDVWGIEQIFPIVPLQRLEERPTRRAVLQDLTCDSDGHIPLYADSGRIERTLPLHPVRPGETYLIGIFLIGAYQEILGDMHNLFGDTDAINVELRPDGGYELVEPERGDRVDELLSYVHYDVRGLLERLREKIRVAGLSRAQRDACIAELMRGLQGNTYLS
jgi:arginine decarboxylase